MSAVRRESAAAGAVVPHVAVCVATYRRPVMLAALLGSLRELAFPGSQRVTVLVVDNDADGSAEPVVRQAQEGFPWTLEYLIAPDRNISLARNHAVSRALDLGADFVGFVDDDEVVIPTWLAELLDAQQRYGADVVCGPVRPAFDEAPAPWVSRGGFFRPHHYPSGTVLDFGLTNNSLVARRVFAGGKLMFDPAFGISGGGDAHFFMRAVRAGARIVWSDDALVQETIPPSRATSSWILRRAFRIGHAYVRCRRAVIPIRRWILPTVAGALARIVYGVVMLIPGLFRGRAGVVKAARTAMHGVGTLSALVGFSYDEYTSVHGR